MLGTLKAIVESGGSPEIEHVMRVRTARIPDGDRSVFEYEMISVLLHVLASVDQLNLPNCLGAFGSPAGFHPRG